MTRLPHGKKIVRACPITHHDFRLTGEAVVIVEALIGTTTIEVKPLRKRAGVVVTVEELYDFATKKAIERKRAEKKARKARRS